MGRENEAKDEEKRRVGVLQKSIVISQTRENIDTYSHLQEARHKIYHRAMSLCGTGADIRDIGAALGRTDSFCGALKEGKRADGSRRRRKGRRRVWKRLTGLRKSGLDQDRHDGNRPCRGRCSDRHLCWSSPSASTIAASSLTCQSVAFKGIRGKYEDVAGLCDNRLSGVRCRRSRRRRRSVGSRRHSKTRTQSANRAKAIVRIDLGVMSVNINALKVRVLI